MRKRRGDERVRGGAWQMGYAGFVTAMMALFIVLWVLSSGKETRAAVAAHFQHPSVSVVRAGGDGLSRDTGTSEEHESLLRSATLIEQAVSSSSTLFQAMGRISIEFVSQGLRIQLHDSPGESPVFEVGSAEPGRETRAILEAAGRILASLPNEIVIEGHTDGRPLLGRTGYGNWELSGDRANSARRILESAGVSPDRFIRVTGYADRRPAVPEDTMDARNRRVSVIICYRDFEPD